MKTLSKVCNKVTQLRLAWLKGSELLIRFLSTLKSCFIAFWITLL